MSEVIVKRRFPWFMAGIVLIKLRMEMGNVPKRQQPDHRADNSRRSPTGL